ncbi:hypothetical protein C8J56DRAFT_1008478 [Mycena floridula]|nr:hypothetical protein C8J56DRAFT_1008478 [Mycena floridula]
MQSRLSAVMVFQHGGAGFQKFKKKLDETVPDSKCRIEVHKTDLHPLPAFELDESTIIGNALVDEAIIEELQVRELSWFQKWVRFIAGDQLTIARLRALFNLRAGKEGGYSSFGWGIWMLGLFHAKIADMHGMLTTHWGKPHCGNRNPGSLFYHNTQLGRLPITLTSLPTFRVCRDLVFVSLYARVLHCLLLVSRYKSLAEYVTNSIYTKYTSALTVSDLRWERDINRPRNVDGNLDFSAVVNEGDMVYENALLFLRDALMSREFTDAIKFGDSGRVLLVLKAWALAYRGHGRTKYAYEMLHLIHNLAHIWPKPIRDIVLNNWILFPSGNPNSGVEVDLVQEHMNYWIKSYYKAHGSNVSWEWLAMIAPCVQALRHIADMMKGSLGIDIGSRHAPPDLVDDIDRLMKSLDENNVYRLTKGRVLDDDDKPVPDVMSVGLQNLTDSTSNPLVEYNKAFLRLQARRRMKPLVGEPPDLEPNISATENDIQDIGGDASDDEEPEDDELADLFDGDGDDDDEDTLGLNTAADVSLDMDTIEGDDFFGIDADI